MSFKTILVHINESRHLQKRVDIAVKLAKDYNATLIGVVATGVSQYFVETLALSPDDSTVLPYLNSFRERGENLLEQFRLSIHQLNAGQLETRLVDDEPLGGMSLHARYADLVVLGQFDPEDPAQNGQAYLPEYVAMNGGCPVLLVPHSSMVATIGERVLIAWNGSPEAKRAVFAALPILQSAKAVEVVTFITYGQMEAIGTHPATDLATYLARHGIVAQVVEDNRVTDIGEALLSIASNFSADLLVMGCYGNSRMRELLLGGATRRIFQSTTVPVLLMH
ncbi:nucleotide-binding universal stress UspA family protein [Paucimonas lemoignei]|uniref:Nucleotide-binding universal stress UspA family protein n=1 Tax=Paucimonas lemoignei TaxID=29443 RepID=A0A4R3I102_PAULE|nr:universal stress protein [Paucimonas lemoignei]TCS39397.1 nucleotide-binding universal stress UspA family protein [Paucimonas lemoignei]